MKRSFERSMLAHGVSREEVWSLSRDQMVLASCSTHIEDVVEQLADSAWSARLTSRVGMVNVSAPVQVAVVEVDELRRIVVRLTGEERRLGTRITVDAIGELSEGKDSVTVKLQGAYEVTGKIANLGSALVEKQATEMIDEFWTNLSGAIERLGAIRTELT